MSDAERLTIDLSGVTVELNGVSKTAARRLRTDWKPFVVEAGESPFLRIDIDHRQLPYAEREFLPKQMKASFAGRIAHYTMPEGEAEFDAAGHGRVRLIPGLADRSYFTLINMIRAGLAWSLPNRRGALLHAAGLLVEGRAFLLVGPEGSGKSRWAAIGELAGQRVISDDLILVDGAGSRVEVLGAPFRSTHRTDYRRGRWPLAAVLFPVKGVSPASSPVTELVAQARLIANLPFIAEGIEQEPRIEETIRRLTGEVPCCDFTFSLEPDFVELLRNWPVQ